MKKIVLRMTQPRWGVMLCFSLYYTFTPLLIDPFYHYLITLLQGHEAKHAIAL